MLDNNDARDFYESIGMGATAELAYSIQDQALADLATTDLNIADSPAANPSEAE